MTVTDRKHLEDFYLRTSYKLLCSVLPGRASSPISSLLLWSSWCSPSRLSLTRGQSSPSHASWQAPEPQSRSTPLRGQSSVVEREKPALKITEETKTCCGCHRTTESCCLQPARGRTAWGLLLWKVASGVGILFPQAQGETEHCWALLRCVSGQAG